MPRNYGHAPGSFIVNLRVSRSFAFGDLHKTAAAAAKPAGQPSSTAQESASGPKRGGAGGPNIATGVGGGGAGAKVGAMSPGGGPQGGPGAQASEKKYNLNVSVNFQNLFNRVNLGLPVGNLLSPSFGESLGLGGSFGGFGGAGGSSGAGNRRIYAQVRLNF